MANELKLVYAATGQADITGEIYRTVSGVLTLIDTVAMVDTTVAGIYQGDYATITGGDLIVYKDGALIVASETFVADFANTTGSQFTTVARVKAYLGITVTTYDDLFTQLIAVATLAIQQACGRKMISDTYTQKFYTKTDNLHNLILDEYPIGAVTSIVDSESVTVEAEDYVVQEEAGIVYIEFLRGWIGWNDADYITVTYTAGYATIPADLEQACIEYVKQMYEDRKINSNLTAERLGDYSYQRLASGGTSSSMIFNNTISRYGKIENNYVG